MARSGIRCGALRLNWSRGRLTGDPAGGPTTTRGIELPSPGEPAPEHRFWLQLNPWRPCFDYCLFQEPYCMTKLLPDAVWPEIYEHLRTQIGRGVLTSRLLRESAIQP